jgi:hypothetical protein
VGLEAPTALLGVDFTCAPGKTKPITLARGIRLGSVVKLDKVGFDFPFGLPRVFVDALMQSPPPGWPGDATEQAAPDRTDTLIAALHRHCKTRQGFAALIDDWGQGWGQGTRPAKLPHRRADTAMPGVSSTSPLQTRYVPVGKMYFEGLWRLVQAGATLPGLPWRPTPACSPTKSLAARATNPMPANSKQVIGSCKG